LQKEIIEATSLQGIARRDYIKKLNVKKYLVAILQGVAKDTTSRLTIYKKLQKEITKAKIYDTIGFMKHGPDFRDFWSDLKGFRPYSMDFT